MQHIIYSTVGERLKNLRKAQGLTQDEISIKVNLSRASINNIENGRHRIQLHILCDFSAAFGVPLIEILS
jgi:transcriptional regulator with XRE-family HTH domain